MSATHDCNFSSETVSVLYCACELGWTGWKLAFTTGPARAPRIVSISARDLPALHREIEEAKRRFRLAPTTQVICCYEAGRDGFWLHRWLCQLGIQSHVVDSSSIEVNRRRRRAKTDRLDAASLVKMLIRHCNGETEHWKVVKDPGPNQEDLRQPQRELIALKDERTRHVNRIKAALAKLGLEIVVNNSLPKCLKQLRQWNGEPVPPELHAAILREFERWKLVHSQINELEKRQWEDVHNKANQDTQVEMVRLLMELKGVGPVSAWLLVRELFGWRTINNRRQLVSLVGLAPSPYQSGTSFREQGISKAGNKRIRWVMVQLAWMWLRYQPNSALSRWYRRRFGHGKGRPRKVGIVALARKLLVALWRYVREGQVPDGAELVAWEEKGQGRAGKPRKKRA